MNVAGHNRKNILGGAVWVVLLLATGIPARAAATVGPSSVSFGNQVVGTTFTRANGSKRTTTLRGIGLQTARLPPSFTTPPISRVVVVGQTGAFLVKATDTGLRPAQRNLDSVRCPSPPMCRNQLG